MIVLFFDGIGRLGGSEGLGGVEGRNGGTEGG